MQHRDIIVHVVYLISDGLVALLKPASPPSFSAHTGEHKLASLAQRIHRGIGKRITSQVESKQRGVCITLPVRRLDKWTIT